MIPLSGTRVALVVGDVVGHGLHASVTMGRLRTAVWTPADVDLPPDELLTHLDDLVGHLGTDESGVIRQVYRGTAKMNGLRRDDLDDLFPGLLDSVLFAAARQADRVGSVTADG